MIKFILAFSIFFLPSLFTFLACGTGVISLTFFGQAEESVKGRVTRGESRARGACALVLVTPVTLTSRWPPLA